MGIVSLIHHDAKFNFTQSLDLTGHANLIHTRDTKGGCKGATFELPLKNKYNAHRMNEGDHITAWDNGMPVYAGRIITKDTLGDGWRFELMGLVEIFGQRIADVTYTNKRASEVFSDLIVNAYAAGTLSPQMSERVDLIGTSPYIVAGTIIFAKTTIKNILDTYNQFDGWEYGTTITANNLDRKQTKSVFRYYAANYTWLHWIVDVNTLANKPVIKPDLTNYGNWIRVYYGTSGLYADIIGTTESRDRYGTVFMPIDISRENTTYEMAVQVGQTYLDNLMIDGIETPPLTTEITINLKTIVDNPRGSRYRNIWQMYPGNNIMILGLKNLLSRSLKVASQRAVMHIEETRRDYKNGTVTHNCRRGYNPAVLLSKFKGLS